MNRILVQEEVCIGCRLCEVHCTAQHSASRDIVKAFKEESPRPVARVRVEEDGSLSFPVQCRHCDEPACVYACLTGAMHRDPRTGAIRVDAERCMGCWTCILVCPNDAIRKGTHNGERVAVKCDLCPDEEIPACVANCPNRALVYGEQERE